MPLQRIVLKPGVNRENTRLTNEGGYYESNLVRFRQGTPEKIGGWQRISANTFEGICRSLWNWTTLAGANLVGVGTEEKFYIEQTGAYYDITPIVSTHILSASPITTVSGSATVTVTDATYHPAVGDYVIFSGVATFNNVTLNGQYKVTSLVNGTQYTVTALTVANASGSDGGSVAYASYLLSAFTTTTAGALGWNTGSWNYGNWGGIGQVTRTRTPVLWTQYNFGQNLLLGPKQGAMYMWNATTAPNLAFPTTAAITNASPAIVTLSLPTGAVSPLVALPDGSAIMFETTGALPLPLTPFTVYYTTSTGTNTYKLSSSYANYVAGTFINTSSAGSGTHTVSVRAIPVSALAGASDVPLTQNTLIVSDASSFTFVFGSNDYLSTTYDPMLVRWSDQESLTNWTPAITNQSGSLRLSHGSAIQAVLQSRQEILVFTDAAIYSLQYLAAPYVWGSQILSDNISIVSQNAATYSSGMAFWMGQDKFYKYDGRVQPLRCDLRQFIYDDINRTQFSQIFAGTNEGFNEVWWFYCTQNSTVIDRYVVYNYMEDAWYYGSMGRTAWLDSSLRDYPMAATYVRNLVYHENGVDDNTTGTTAAMNAWITTAQFDIGDGHNFAFVWRMLPDLTFRGSTDGTTPSLAIQLQPLQNSGSGYNNPKSVGGSYNQATPSPTQKTQFYNAAVTAQKMIVGLLPVDLYYDLNGDGVVDLQDAIGFLNLSIGSPLVYTPNPASIYTSIAGEAWGTVVATQTYPIDLDTFTGQLNIRVRGRQMSMRVESNKIGTQWQMGAPRIDIRPDGRR